MATANMMNSRSKTLIVKSITAGTTGPSINHCILEKYKKIVFDISSNVTSLTNLLVANECHIDEVVVNFRNASITSMKASFQGNNQNFGDGTGFIRKITLNGSTASVTSFSNTFYYPQGLISIEGDPIDFSSAVDASSMFSYSFNELKEVRFVENSLKIDFYPGVHIYGFSDDTLISIGNCLNESSAKTLTLYRTIYSKASSILGESLYDTEKGYHVFMKNENGSMNLSDFITNIKGWSFVSA